MLCGISERPFRSRFHLRLQPSTKTLSNFKNVPETAKGGMEKAESLIVSFHRVLDGQEIPVLDDNGNPSYSC